MNQALADVERALQQHGLLLQHDKELPSVTSIVAGGPVAGSWWGHRLGHHIYDVIGELEQRSGKLSTKLIDGKVTYVHDRLWPAFFSVAQAAVVQRLAQATEAAAELYARVEQHGPMRADSNHVPPALAAAPRELSKAIRALEGKLLVHSESVHTESGAHVKVLRSWPQWCAEQSISVPTMVPTSARRQLDAALVSLVQGTGRKPKVPW